MTAIDDDFIRSQRSALIKRELAITALREQGDDLDESLLDEIAALAAELDQDWAGWRELADAYDDARRARSGVKTRLESVEELEQSLSELLAQIEEAEVADGDTTGHLAALKMDVHAQREHVRTLRSAAPAPAGLLPLCVRLRPQPRARARRSRAVSRASSRGGDSGDDSGESDGPALARLGRALRHALTRCCARARQIATAARRRLSRSRNPESGGQANHG